MLGILEISSVYLLSIKPAIAKLWPSAKVISDCSRRVDSAGMKKPWMVSAFVKSKELTSGLTFKWIWPSVVREGVKFKRTPNSLNWIVIPAKPPPEDDWRIGNGNSPPARKLASFPDAVIKFGSARISSKIGRASCRERVWMAEVEQGLAGRRARRRRT